MGRRQHYIPLDVWISNRIVGQLIRESTGAISFIYDQRWLDWEHAFPVSLSLPLRKDRFIGARVIPVFENLLPDNDGVRKRLAERVGADGTDAFSLLSVIGRDCIGALQFLPQGSSQETSNQLEGTVLSEHEIEVLLGELEEVPLGLQKENDFRISIAGAQEKTALLFHNGEWSKPTGTTPTTHILKPQIGKLSNGMDLTHSVENEFLCLKLLKNFGLRTANTEIIDFGSRRALVIERFDRRWTADGRLIRLPQEDCCQALSIPPTRKYQSEGGPGIVEIMDLFRGSDEPTQDRMDFFMSTILFWAIGATDGHGKNFSLSLMPGGRYRMTPLYDVLTLQPSVDAKQVAHKNYKLSMSFGKSRHYKIKEIAVRHIIETGVEAGLSRQSIAEIFDQLCKDKDKAIEHTLQGLPKDFPQKLLDSTFTALEKHIALLDNSR
ncbi:type II toxin-antitoxin system HipA family toxin [Methylophaga sp.]|uniref:type II toxin-antitoxin system HipA family toxin n=1 Tax=Methylophaga sp. TaxID=2024840 RepID=UPI003F705F14